MTTREIVEKHLKDNGFDGLYFNSYLTEDGAMCGCSLSGELSPIIPCDDKCNKIPFCKPGVYCDLECGKCNVNDICIVKGDGIKCIVERVAG